MTFRALALILGLATVPLVHADIAVSNPAGTGSWYAPVIATSTSVNAFWDNKSVDSSSGVGCNVGYWLQNPNWNSMDAVCGNFHHHVLGDGGPGPLSFFAADAAHGGATTPVGFDFTPLGVDKTTLRVEVSGFQNTNTFGWYLLSAPAATHQLFSGPDGPGKISVDFSPTGSFGFYLCPNGNCANIIRSSDPFTGNGNGKNGKFALFSEAPKVPTLSSQLTKYWLGIEDGGGTKIAGRERLGDYNDMIVSVSSVPEPGFYGLLALGLSGLCVAVIRRRRADG